MAGSGAACWAGRTWTRARSWQARLVSSVGEEEWTQLGRWGQQRGGPGGAVGWEWGKVLHTPVWPGTLQIWPLESS